MDLELCGAWGRALGRGSLGTGVGFGVSLGLRAQRGARGHSVVGACSSAPLVPASFHTRTQGPFLGQEACRRKSKGWVPKAAA